VIGRIKTEWEIIKSKAFNPAHDKHGGETITQK